MPLNICGFPLTFSLSKFQLLYAVIASFMWICALLFSVDYMKYSEKKLRYYTFMLLTYAATIGIFLSADLMTTFLFFEIMSFTSYVLVVQEETPQAMRAGETYLTVAVLGGMILLMGLFLLYDAFGSLRFEDLHDLSVAYPNKTRLYTAGILIFTGFGAKAGIFPLHIWLPKAHPVAPAPASALLSGILTKTGVFGVLVISSRLFFEDATWGSLLLIPAIITMVLGAFLAVFSVDLKRTLACSSVSQIGFITLGISMSCIMGIDNALAARGTILHMVNHSLLKLLLFMSAGVIYMNLHKLNLNTIKGYGRKKPFLKILFLIGALSISGIPLTSGYISKTLLHEAIVEYIHHGVYLGHNMFAYQVAEGLFLLSGALTVAYMTKLFICIFIETNNDSSLQEAYDHETAPYLGTAAKISLGLPATILFIFGVLPYGTIDKVADFSVGFLSENALAHPVHYFTLKNLSGSFISIALGSLIYVIIQKMLRKKTPEGQKVYLNLWPVRVDLEEAFYRPLLAFVVRISYVICTILSSVWDTTVAALAVLGGFLTLSTVGDRAVWVTMVVGGFSAKATNVFGHQILTKIQRNLFGEIRPHEEKFKPLDWVKNHPLSDKWSRIKEAALTLSESMSFWLLATVIGLCVVLLYLL